MDAGQQNRGLSRVPLRSGPVTVAQLRQRGVTLPGVGAHDCPHLHVPAHEAGQRSGGSVRDHLQSGRAYPPFIHGVQLPLASRAEIEHWFGPRFAEAVEHAEVQTWVGPIRSSYGVHLVWIHQRAPGAIPSYDAVRNQVVHALLRERSTQRLRERLAALRGRYQIVMAGAP